MNTHNLHKRIDKLLEAIHTQQPRERAPIFRSFEGKMHLFTEQEQALLQDFLLLPEVQASSSTLDYLTSSQLDQYKYWLYLKIALDNEDIQAAAEYRQLLKQSQEESSERTPEQLVARFRAIDTRLFRTPISPGPGIYLTNFHLLHDKIARGERLNGIDWTQVEWWDNYYERYPAMIASYAAHKAKYGRV